MRVKVLLLVGLLALAGCSSKPKLVPVSGRIVVDGAAITGDTAVTFIPVEGLGKERVQGMIGPKGEFKLNTYPHGDGVMPGKYKVLVQFGGGKAFEHYSNVETTPLEVDVPNSGLTDYEIKLTPKK